MKAEDFKKKDAADIFYLETEEQNGGVPLLKYPLLARTGMVAHGFTTRAGGVSEGMFSTLNLSYTRGDKKEAVDENFKRVALALHASVEDFVLSDQTHTTNIRRVTGADRGKGIVRERDYRDVDGLITDEPGIVLSTFYADCVPLFFVDTVHRAVGLAHSGWRGTVARMGRAMVQAMRDAYGTKPQELICAIGPSICQDCYEVDGDVASRFMDEFPQAGRKLCYPAAAGKYQLNLWHANRLVLEEAGVLPKHIAVTNICTCCNANLLFSHRASHGRRGNLGAFLKIVG